VKSVQNRFTSWERRVKFASKLSSDKLWIWCCVQGVTYNSLTLTTQPPSLIQQKHSVKYITKSYHNATSKKITQTKKKLSSTNFGHVDCDNFILLKLISMNNPHLMLITTFKNFLYTSFVVCVSPHQVTLNALQYATCASNR
jgi:hypothetical protein